MPHIHTKPGQHDHTASAYIIRLDDDEPKIMLHLHRKLGKYLQFGGHIELDETPWQTVLHEVKEESGYDASQLRLLQPKQRVKHLSDVDQHPYPVCYNTHKFNDTHFHTDIGFALVTSEAPRFAPEEGESQDIRLLTRAELLALPDELCFENIKQIGLFIFDECLKNWEQIPVEDWPV